MKNLNTRPPTGTRDFLPRQVKKREELLSVVKNVFESFGFAPIETPAFERIDTLMGKYGQEGEKLIFKILKRGEQADDKEADLALRYDLTIPLARFMAEYQAKLPKIFRGYQIGSVWRAEKPGRGRLREFYQADIDIVGSSSLTADAEIILALSKTLAKLGISNLGICLNSKKILEGLSEMYKVLPQLNQDFLISLDKLDKVGVQGVEQELVSRGLPSAVVKEVVDDLQQPTEVITAKIEKTSIGRVGLREVEEITKLVEPLLPTGSRLKVSPFLARGLDYYTGLIFEIYVDQFGSAVAGGGRYDNLVGLFTNKLTPACGGSLGIERILLLREQEEGEKESAPAEVLVTVWEINSQTDALRLANKLRDRGIRTDIYLATDKIGKQLRYAADCGIRYCLLLGPDEKAKGEVAIKDLETGSQMSVLEEELTDKLLNLIQKR